MLDNNQPLKAGHTITITTEECVSTSERVFISYENLAKEVEIGDGILIDDGRMELRVTSTDRDRTLEAKVITGGKLSNNKGVNLPIPKPKCLRLPKRTKKI